MKKILALMLAALMLLSVVACTPANEDPQEPEKTLGDYFAAEFKSIVEADPDITPMGVLEQLLQSKPAMAAGFIAPLGPVPGPDEEFGVPSFDDRFDGYVSGEMFGHMTGSSPFRGFVFELAEGTDATAFMNKLQSVSNLAWPVCVSANEFVTASAGNLVFALYNDQKVPSFLSGKPEVVEPTNLPAGSTAETVWNTFKTVMTERVYEVSQVAKDIADAMCAAGVTGTVAEGEGYITTDYFEHELDMSYNAVTITNGEQVVYLFALDLGMTPTEWAEYSCAAKEGADVIWGIQDTVVIAMVNMGA